MPLASVIAVFQRTHKQWQIAAARLEKSGKDVVKPEGFKLFVAAKPEFADIYKHL